MKEIKNIDQLFQAARAEKPQRTFEEVAQQFTVSLPPTSILGKAKAFFINLNNLLLMTAISLAITVGFFLFHQPNTSEKDITSNVATTVDMEKTKDAAPQRVVEPMEKIAFEITEPTEIAVKPSPIIDENPIEAVATPFDKQETEAISSTMELPEEKFIVKAKGANPKEKRPFLANQIKIVDSTSAVNLATTTTTAKSTIQPLEHQPIELPTAVTKKSITLQLSKEDSRKAVADFAKVLNGYGLQTNIAQQKRAAGQIRKLSFQFQHAAGLDWRMKLQGFDVLEMKVLLDKQQRPYGVTYRLNQNGEFVEYLTLKHRSRSVHKFADKRTKSRHQHTRQLTNERYQ